ncbi:MAG TPA: Clp protease N-terminal domain-containing protein, partial [Tepidisphaeraceae bacterium]|nr:Clp protease N-terminal domain-containing protein [Tepidisphaeraceae bacterium]
MYERFSERARKVMALANQEAQRFKHEYIGTEHILLGLVWEGTGVGANVLKMRGIELSKVRVEVERVVKSGSEMISMGKLPQTPRAKKVIEFAIQEARALGQNYVGTEHLLLGLIREEEGVAGQVLRNLGLNLEHVRRETLNILGAPEHGGGETPQNSMEAVINRHDMFKQFTEHARKVMALANQEAQRFNHEYIGTEHILLGLVKEASGVGANVLKEFDLDLRKVRLEVERIVKSGPDMVSTGKLPQTPPAMKVIEYAIEEAARLGHSYVGTEHLLLGLIREEDGVAGQVLRNLGLDLEKVRKQVLRVLEGGAKAGDRMPPVSKTIRGQPMQYGVNAFRVGIVGVSGYGGGEVLRICASHSDFQVVYVAGEGSAGQKLIERFPGVGKYGDLTIERWNPDEHPELDLLFASLPTGQSKESLAKVGKNVKIVDIGGDHRYVEGWTYGLADVWPEKIRASTRVANPGCYPSAALAAIAPLIAANLVKASEPIIIDAKSGVSGAGRGGGDNKFGFAEVNEDVSAYGLLKHAHVPEITATIQS